MQVVNLLNLKMSAHIWTMTGYISDITYFLIVSESIS